VLDYTALNIRQNVKGVLTMVTKNNKRSSKNRSSKSAFVSNSAFNRGAKNNRSRKSQPIGSTRKGSMPDIHRSLVGRIAEDKTLRAAGRMAVNAGAAALSAHGASVMAAVLPAAYKLVSSKLVTNIEEPPGSKSPGVGFRPTSIQQSVHPPVQRNLVDNMTYYTRLEVREGETSRMIKAAKKMYPSSNHDYWSTGSAYCCDMLYACHGINQTGFWQPYTGTKGIAYAEPVFNQCNKMTITGKDIYRFLQQSLNTSDLVYANNMDSNEDLLFNIESATSKFVARNASELTPCICTAYLIQAQNKITSNKYPVQLATRDTDFPDGYILNPTVQDIYAYDGATAPDFTQFFVENSARLGYTLQMSNQFNTLFNVIDVIKSPVLNPGDQWNFTFKQHYAHPTGYNELRYLLGPTPDFNDGNYLAGDYEIVLQFQGAAGFVNNVNSSVSTGSIRFSTNSNPCMIAVTQSRTIQYRFPDSLGSSVRDISRFVSDVVREIDTTPRVSPYFGEGNYQFRATAMTQTESREANADGIGRSMDDD